MGVEKKEENTKSIDQNREEVKMNIEKIVATKESEIAGYKVKLDAALAAAEAAHSESTKCYSADDVKGYHKSQDEYRTNTDAADMYRKKIDELEKTPYISEKEFQDAANIIYEELNDEVEAAGAEIAKLVKKMVDISEKTAKSINQWENYVLNMQRNIRKDNCNLITAKGVETSITDHARIKRFKNKDIVTFVQSVRDHDYINKYLGKVESEKIASWGKC